MVIAIAPRLAPHDVGDVSVTGQIIGLGEFWQRIKSGGRFIAEVVMQCAKPLALLDCLGHCRIPMKVNQRIEADRGAPLAAMRPYIPEIMRVRPNPVSLGAFRGIKL